MVLFYLLCRITRWQNLDAPEVLPVFAEAILIRLRGYEHDVINLSNIHQGEKFVELLANAEQRKTVLKTVAPLLNEEKHDFFQISQSQILRPRKEDLFWLFEELNRAKTEEGQRIWLQMLGNFYFPWAIEPEVFSILSEVYQHNEAAKKCFSWVFTLVDLNTPEAEAQRNGYEQATAPRRKMEAELQKNALKLPPKERVLVFSQVSIDG